MKCGIVGRFDAILILEKNGILNFFKVQDLAIYVVALSRNKIPYSYQSALDLFLKQAIIYILVHICTRRLDTASMRALIQSFFQPNYINVFH